jgi:hypothetical protein
MWSSLRLDYDDDEISNFLIFLLGVLLPFVSTYLCWLQLIYFDVECTTAATHFFTTVRKELTRLNGKNRRSAAADGQGESHQIRLSNKTETDQQSTIANGQRHTVIGYNRRAKMEAAERVWYPSLVTAGLDRKKKRKKLPISKIKNQKIKKK